MSKEFKEKATAIPISNRINDKLKSLLEELSFSSQMISEHKVKILGDTPINPPKSIEEKGERDSFVSRTMQDLDTLYEIATSISTDIKKLSEFI